MNGAAISAALARLRSEAGGCSLVLLSDIRSGTVLAADGALAYPQEHLDALSTSAAQVLSSPGLPDEGYQCVLFRESTRLRVFARSLRMPDVALTCLGPPDADVARLRDGMTGFLSEFTKESMT